MPAKALRLLVVALLATAGGAPALRAQTPTVIEVTPAEATAEIRLADGSVLLGRITEVNEQRVTIVTTGGARLEVERAQIRSVRLVDGAGRTRADFWPEDPNGTRLFLGPTARNLPAGQGSFGVFELFFPFVNYAVTDRFSIAGGTPIVPEAIGQVAYIAPQLQVVRGPRMQAAVGAMAGFGTDDISSVGLLYGVGTFGDPDRSFTVSAAVPFITDGNESDLGNDPLIMVGGESRISRRVKLLSENYFILGESGAVISGGVRILADRLTADVGAAAGFGSESFCCLPLVNFVYTFGGR